MGREAEAQVNWRGESGNCRAVLESDVLILRGEIRARLPRAHLTGAVADGETLRIATPDGPLEMMLGAAETAKWLTALMRPLPSLAEKLGVSVARPAFVLGRVSDTALSDALNGACATTVGSAAMLVAEILTTPDLDAALAAAQQNPALPLWCVYRKGPKVQIGDAAIRSHLRAAGMMDTKTSAVSDAMTATRYSFPKA